MSEPIKLDCGTKKGMKLKRVLTNISVDTEGCIINLRYREFMEAPDGSEVEPVLSTRSLQDREEITQQRQASKNGKLVYEKNQPKMETIITQDECTEYTDWMAKFGSAIISDAENTIKNIG